MIKNNKKEVIDIREKYKEKLVYIDFESVSPPFIYDSDFKKVFPFAYSAAIYGENKIFTYIYESRKTWNNIDFIKLSLMKFLKVSTVEELAQYRFVGWNGALERKVLTNLFKNNYKYIDLMLSDRNFRAALADVAAKDEPFNLDFKYSRKFVSPKIKDLFLKKRNGKVTDFEPKTNFKELKSGAVASFVGAIKYGALSIKGRKWIKDELGISLEEVDLDKMTKELDKYSKKDVQDMIDISDNFQRSLRRYNFLRDAHQKRIMYKKRYWNNYPTLNRLYAFCDGKGKTMEILDSYVEANKDAYLKKANSSIEIDKENEEYQNRISELFNGYKKSDTKAIDKLKRMLTKEKMLFPDFNFLFIEYKKRLELYKKQKIEMMIKTKKDVKNIL